jgi:hypothetical protein
VRLVRIFKECNILFLESHFSIMSEFFLYPSFTFSNFLKQHIIVTTNTFVILDLPINFLNCVIYDHIEPKKSSNLETSIKKGGVSSIKSKLN